MEENQQTTEKQSNNMNPIMVIGAVVMLAIIGLVVFLGMGRSNNLGESDETMSPNNDQQSEATPSLNPAGGIEETTIIDVEGGSFYYKPNEIRVKAGEVVTITLNSVDMMHDFVIDELDVKSDVIEGGKSTTFSFTPTEPGEYEFYCSVGSHRANGMVGTLIVE